MFVKFLIPILLFKTIFAQINGEFWWLNDKVTKLKGVEAPQVTYEDVSYFDTDESDKIVFREGGVISNHSDIILANTGRNESESQTKNNSKIKFPDNKYININFHVNINMNINNSIPNNLSKSNINETVSKKNILTQEYDDILNILYPDDNMFNITNISISLKNKSENLKLDNDIQWNDNIRFKEEKNTENVCTFMKKSTCHRNEGVILTKYESSELQKRGRICCVLPLQKTPQRPDDDSDIIYFTKNTPPEIPKRSKRSDEQNMSPALKQRHFLVFHRFDFKNDKAKPTPLKTLTKVVTPNDEYVDPYWNIKNTNFQRPDVHKTTYQAASAYDEYEQDDYVEDYIVEIPKPGLVGLYSDHSQRPSSWTLSNANKGSSYDSIEETDTSFGYSTLDPRLVDRTAVVTSKTPNRGRPLKFTTTDEPTYDADSQTISYTANPDFKVFQGFKLLNLARNKSRNHSNNERKSTTQRIIINDSSETVKIKPIIVTSTESDYSGSFEVSDRNANCGIIKKNPLDENGEEASEIESNSHPWLALVVLTRRPQSIVCYSTIVHPRAAVTVGDCVQGLGAGDISVIAGLRHLRDRTHSQQRMASIRLQRRQSNVDITHNLAILHWKRPLRLGVSVQPACLGNARVGDDCKLVGWGGYDQAIRPKLGWQRATVLTPRNCAERLSGNHKNNPPKDAFCASIESRLSVTGIGGPLLCKISDRQTLVGVALWRDDVVVLTPPHDWTLQALANLGLS